MDILTKRNHYHSWCDKTYTKPRYEIQEPHNCSVGLACNIHRMECFRHLIKAKTPTKIITIKKTFIITIFQGT